MLIPGTNPPYERDARGTATGHAPITRIGAGLSGGMHRCHPDGTVRRQE
jgi:hypothetical protein